jgi:hypothetical protein
MTAASLNPAERQALAALADVLIPPSPKGLSASEAGLGGGLIDMLETHAPERLPLLRRAIALGAGTTPEAGLAALRAEDPAAYDNFCETIAAVYFMAPAVREAVGFPGRLPRAARIEVSDIEDLLMPVLEAGFAPRPTPSGRS